MNEVETLEATTAKREMSAKEDKVRRRIKLVKPPTTVINLRTGFADDDTQLSIYIGKGSPWGNLYMGRGESRILAVTNYYRDVYLRGPKYWAEIRSQLRGKVLKCWCHPWLCHGHLLQAIAEGYRPTKPKEGRVITSIYEGPTKYVVTWSD